MIIGTEHLRTFEELVPSQKRIYDDAADFGVILSPELKAKLLNALQSLREIYTSTLTKWGEKSYSHGSTTSLFIPFELENGRHRGVRLVVTYNFDKSKKIEFISVDIDNATSALSGFKS